MTARLFRVMRLAALPLVLVLGAFSVPSVSAGNPCFHGFTMPAASSGTGNEIKLLPCAFAPTIAHVAVGSEATFVNGPDFSHLITGANQEWGSPDVELAPGSTVSYTFDQAGIYPYACVLHPGMSGAIVVGDLAAGAVTGGSTAAPGSTASGASPDGRLLAALGIVAGLIAGAVAWFRLRRRSSAVPGYAEPMPESRTQGI